MRHFFHHLIQMSTLVRSVFLAQLGLILVGAVVIAAVESKPLGDATYFAFITGLTIGYGDIVPETGPGRIVSVLLVFIGITYTGLVVAVAVKALQEAVQEAKSPSS